MSYRAGRDGRSRDPLVAPREFTARRLGVKTGTKPSSRHGVEGGMAMLPLHDPLHGQAQITVLSALAVAVFVVEERRRVLFANPAGSRLLQAGGALRKIGRAHG